MESSKDGELTNLQRILHWKTIGIGSFLCFKRKKHRVGGCFSYQAAC